MYKFPSRSLEPKVIAQPSAARRERAFRSDYEKQLLAESVLAGCVLKKNNGLWNMYLMAVWVGLFLILKSPGYACSGFEISYFMKDFQLKAS